MAETSNSAGSGDFYRMGQQSMKTGLSIEAPDTGIADAFEGVATNINKMGGAMAAENKAREKELKEERETAGDKISQAFIEMGPQLKTLGQESYTQAQNEVEALREEMYAAINADDKKAQADINIRLNEMKTRHAGDADSLDTLITTWEADDDGNTPVSTAAMSKADIAIMENFVANKSKRTVYTDDNPPRMMYEFDVPVVDAFGQPKIDAQGDAVMQDPPPRYSLEDLQNKLILKETVNGNKYLELEQTMKETISNGGKPPSKAEMKRRVGEVIPKDKKKIRDWLHGNPAEQYDLDVHGYLTDLVQRDFGTYEKMGIDLTKEEYQYLDKDTPKDGVQADEVPGKFKTDLIDDIMNVKDLNISHDILTDIYAARGLNNVMGVEYQEDDDIAGGFVGNKDYNSSDGDILGMDDFDPNEEDAKKNAAIMDKLAALSDEANLVRYKGMSEEAIAGEIGVDPNKGIYNPKTKQTETVATYIASAIDEKAIGDTSKF